MRELNKKMAAGALWMALMRVSVRGLGLVSTLILARILVPADFGLVAMATSILAFLQLATAFSFDIPLIQNQSAGRSHFDTAWTLNLLFYLLLTVMVILLAEPAAVFYQEERLTTVIYVLAAGFFLKGFDNIGIVYFRKELNFRMDFVLMFTKKMITFLITIPLAFILRNYWALVAGMVAGNFFGMVLTYITHPYRPRPSLAEAREMMNFSKWLLLNNVFGFLRMRSPDFVIGRIAGTTELGLFNIAFEISTLPTTELVAPINRVVFPGYSQIADDQNRLRQSYLDVLALIALVALPAGLGISALADPLVGLALGEKWSAAAPLVAVLAIFGSINAIQTNSGSVFNAIGKPYLIALIGIINITSLLALSIPLAVAYGPYGVAVAYVGSFAFLLPFTLGFVCHELRIGIAMLIGVLIRPFLGAAAMYAIVVYIDGWLAEGGSGDATRLMIGVAVGVVVYSTIVVFLWYAAGRPQSAEYRLTRLALMRLSPGR